MVMPSVLIYLPSPRQWDKGSDGGGGGGGGGLV